jgi:hypothetical protein
MAGSLRRADQSKVKLGQSDVYVRRDPPRIALPVGASGVRAYSIMHFVIQPLVSVIHQQNYQAQVLAYSSHTFQPQQS